MFSCRYRYIRSQKNGSFPISSDIESTKIIHCCLIPSSTPKCRHASKFCSQPLHHIYNSLAEMRSQYKIYRLPFRQLIRETFEAPFQLLILLLTMRLSITNKLLITLLTVFGSVLVALTTYQYLQQRELINSVLGEMLHDKEASNYFDSLNMMMLTGTMAQKETLRKRLWHRMVLRMLKFFVLRR